MQAARQRAQDAQELAFLRALRVAIPAALDSKAASGYEKREGQLLKLIQP